ncbi:hypothetical protein [Luteibacter sp. CQ10]|uniref:hypothetical protein n=1 Tax=Luteibacter sp. CQ10 TaxID=2805821 RepID=UPI0034A48E09
MKTLAIRNDSGTFVVSRQVDPDSFSEQQFEYMVVQALCAAYPDYRCITLGGATFRHQQERRKPDLALVARDYSHWFVVEVELSSHSLDHHVLPQVRCFSLGEPEQSCITALSNGLGLSFNRSATIATLLPRGAVVVSNRWNHAWASALRALSCPLLSVSIFDSADGNGHLEIFGQITYTSRSIGFGKYIATDRAIRFGKAIPLPTGKLEITDTEGFKTRWIIRRSQEHLWASKIDGYFNFAHESTVQIIQDINNCYSIRIL